MADNERRAEILHLYDLSVQHAQYMHSDLWRAQQFYTTLSVGILGASLSLVKVGSPSLVLASVGILAVGIFVAFFGKKKY